MVFAPTRIRGVGITPINVIIAQKKIQLLHSHLRKKTELGKACLINIQWAMLQAGRRNPIFTSDDRIDYIENKWIIHLHNTLRLRKGKLLIQEIKSNPLLREHDQYLMDMWDKRNFKINILYQLNLCRIYLRVATLSDIVSNDEKTT